ncbi:cuticle protein 6.4 [Halyomorpha halys]|uniref:cuticle protein 6.4 n=1 Tax=Halyomorpha halys TaxID=286706 RepID=UPI0006D4D41D|nr:prisilkin-39-like [Halyomorpha halys]
MASLKALIVFCVALFAIAFAAEEARDKRGLAYGGYGYGALPYSGYSGYPYGLGYGHGYNGYAGYGAYPYSHGGYGAYPYAGVSYVHH